MLRFRRGFSEWHSEPHWEASGRKGRWPFLVNGDKDFVLNHAGNKSGRGYESCVLKPSPRVGNGGPMGQTEPTTCFSMARELRMVFILLNSWKKSEEFGGMWKMIWNWHVRVDTSFYWNAATFMCVCGFHGCFHTKPAERRSRRRETKACRAENCDRLALFRSLLPPALTGWTDYTRTN